MRDHRLDVAVVQSQQLHILLAVAEAHALQSVEALLVLEREIVVRVVRVEVIGDVVVIIVGVVGSADRGDALDCI